MKYINIYELNITCFNNTQLCQMVGPLISLTQTFSAPQRGTLPKVISKRGNPIPTIYGVTWKFDPFFMPEHGHPYSIRTIHLSQDIMANIIPLSPFYLVRSSLHHLYVYKYHNKARTRKHHTIIESQP